MSFDLTEKDRAVLEYLAIKGPTWYYHISYGKDKVASNKIVLKSFKKLEQNDLVTVIKAESCSKGLVQLEGRKRIFYSLTFKGLVMAIKEKLIEPKDAVDSAGRNKIDLPIKRTSTCENAKFYSECRDIRDFVENHSEAFYTILACFDIKNADQDEMNEFCCTAMMLGYFYLYLNDSKFRWDTIRKDELGPRCFKMDAASGLSRILLRNYERMLKALGIQTNSVTEISDNEDALLERYWTERDTRKNEGGTRESV